FGSVQFSTALLRSEGFVPVLQRVSRVLFFLLPGKLAPAVQTVQDSSCRNRYLPRAVRPHRRTFSDPAGPWQVRSVLPRSQASAEAPIRIHLRRLCIHLNGGQS